MNYNKPWIKDFILSSLNKTTHNKNDANLSVASISSRKLSNNSSVIIGHGIHNVGERDGNEFVQIIHIYPPKDPNFNTKNPNIITLRCLVHDKSVKANLVLTGTYHESARRQMGPGTVLALAKPKVMVVTSSYAFCNENMEDEVCMLSKCDDVTVYDGLLGSGIVGSPQNLSQCADVRMAICSFRSTIHLSNHLDSEHISKTIGTAEKFWSLPEDLQQKALEHYENGDEKNNNAKFEDLGVKDNEIDDNGLLQRKDQLTMESEDDLLSASSSLCPIEQSSSQNIDHILQDSAFDNLKDDLGDEGMLPHTQQESKLDEERALKECGEDAESPENEEKDDDLLKKKTYSSQLLKEKKDDNYVKMGSDFENKTKIMRQSQSDTIKDCEKSMTLPQNDTGKNGETTKKQLQNECLVEKLESTTVEKISNEESCTPLVRQEDPSSSCSSLPAKRGKRRRKVKRGAMYDSYVKIFGAPKLNTN